MNIIESLRSIQAQAAALEALFTGFKLLNPVAGRLVNQ